MMIVLRNAPEVGNLLSILAGCCRLERESVALTLTASPEGVEAEIAVVRRRDHDAAPVTVFQYCQQLPPEAAEGEGIARLEKKAAAELCESTEGEWQEVSLPSVVGLAAGPDALEAAQSSECETCWKEGEVSTEELVVALEQCAELPPLDATQAGDLHLSLHNAVLDVERRVGEVSVKSRVRLKTAAGVNAHVQLPQELALTLASDLKSAEKTTLCISATAGQEVQLEGSFGTFLLRGYEGGPTAQARTAVPLVACFSFSPSGARLAADIVSSCARSTSGNPIRLEVREEGILLSSQKNHGVERIEVDFPIGCSLQKKTITHTYRANSLLKVLRAARRFKEGRFYVDRDGVLFFKANKGVAVVRAECVTTEDSSVEKPPIIWASGGSSQLIVRSPHRHLLISFAEFSPLVRRNAGELERLLAKKGLLDSGMKVFLDSGAYSVWRSGAQVDFAEYMQFLKWNAGFFDTYVALDVIRGTVKENVENYLRMVEAGLSPLYVWHLYEDFQLLERLLEDYRHAIRRGGIGAGGAPRTPYPIREPYIAELIGRVYRSVSAKFHLFGTTSEWFLKKYCMVYSADSTSWRHQSDHHEIYTPFGDFSTVPSAPRSIWGHRLQREVERFIAALAFTGIDMSLREMALDDSARRIYNLGYLHFLEQYLPFLDWMRLEQRFIPFDELRSRGRLNLKSSAVILPQPRNAMSLPRDELHQAA